MLHMLAGCGKGFCNPAPTPATPGGRQRNLGLRWSRDQPRLPPDGEPLHLGLCRRSRRYLGTYGLELTWSTPPTACRISLPEAGECVADVSMFPQDAGTYGTEIPNASPAGTGWQRRRILAPGFYHADVLGNQRSCIFKLDAHPGCEHRGCRQPRGGRGPGSDLEIVSFDGENTQLNQGIDFGSELTLSGGQRLGLFLISCARSAAYAYGSVTCNTTGQDSFLIDDEVWSLLDQDLNVETLNLFVGFQNDGELELESGLKSGPDPRHPCRGP